MIVNSVRSAGSRLPLLCQPQQHIVKRNVVKRNVDKLLNRSENELIPILSIVHVIMTSTTTKEAIVGLIAARTEDDQCLQFVYGSTSSLSGAGVATDVELGEFKLVVDEVRFGTLLTPRAAAAAP